VNMGLIYRLVTVAALMAYASWDLIVFPALAMPEAAFVQAQNSSREAMGLEDCISIALSRNLRLLKQQYEQQAARLESSVSYKEMLPRLSTGYSYTGRRDAATVVIFGHSTTISGHDQYRWDLNIQQPVFYGGLLWNRYKSARIDVDIAALALAQARNDIIRETKVAFYQVLKDVKLLDEARASIKRLEAQLSDVREFFNIGLRPRTDLLQSQVELSQGRLQLVKARNQLELARNRLNLVLKRPLDTPVILKDQLSETRMELTLENLYSLAYASRPEILQAEKAVSKAEHQVKIAKSEFFPRVDLTASYSKEGVTPDVSDNPYGDHDMAQVMLNATWELFSWGKSRDRVAAAEARLKEARTGLEDVKDHVAYEVKNAFMLWKDAQEGVRVAESALEHAKEDYELNRSRYRQQLASNTDTLDAQSRLTRARSEYFSAIALELSALAQLEYAIGKEIKNVQD
jgi:outer membrane protein TolC